MSQQVITSLAILTVNYRRNNNYLDLFVPFVAESIPNEVISLPVLQKQIEDKYSLHIPQNTLKSILKRAEQSGCIARTPDNIFKLVKPVNISQVSSDVARQFEHLLGQIVEHCKKHFTLELSSEGAEELLLAYIQEHSIPVLSAAVDGRMPLVVDETLHNSNLYPIYHYVKTISESMPTEFKFLVTIVKGRMLADVLLFPDLSTVRKQFEGVEVYLDTPFLLGALGYLGANRAIPGIEMLQMLNDQKARLYVFQHNLREVEGILEDCERQIQQRSRNNYSISEVCEYFIEQRMDVADIVLLRNKLETSLNKMDVQIKSTPQYRTELGVDEVKLTQLLQQRIGYRSEPARDKDIKSLTAIHRLRQGYSYTYLEKCKALFVTTNEALAR